MNLRHFGDNFIPVIPVDYKEHTPKHPFCWNQACPCHEDSEAIAVIHQTVQNGLMTPEEATDFVLGKLIQGGKMVLNDFFVPCGLLLGTVFVSFLSMCWFFHATYIKSLQQRVRRLEHLVEPSNSIFRNMLLAQAIPHTFM